MNPIKFLRALRLSEVRREIPFASSVTDAATQLGFWHFGYFARDYRYMFGELPSATITAEAQSLEAQSVVARGAEGLNR